MALSSFMRGVSRIARPGRVVVGAFLEAGETLVLGGSLHGGGRLNRSALNGRQVSSCSKVNEYLTLSDDSATRLAGAHWGTWRSLEGAAARLLQSGRGTGLFGGRVWSDQTACACRRPAPSGGPECVSRGALRGGEACASTRCASIAKALGEYPGRWPLGHTHMCLFGSAAAGGSRDGAPMRERAAREGARRLWFAWQSGRLSR